MTRIPRWMDRRALAMAALAAAMTQFAPLAMYYVYTDGCFCAVDGAGVPLPPRWFVPFASVMMQPATSFPRLPGGPVAFIALNLLAWTAGWYMVYRAAARLRPRLVRA